MPPCCQIPPGPYGNFLISLKYDTKQFSQYVGLGNPAGLVRYPNFLTSGLHFEMKLWPPHGGLPRRYRFNDAQYNSWFAMSNRTTAPAAKYPRFTYAEKCKVFLGLCSSFPHRSGCALVEYDQWILLKIQDLRLGGLCHAGLHHPWMPPGKPPELSTIGLAQKLINIYVKYEFCWQIAGQWPALKPYAPPFSPQDFLCALHAPIDNGVIVSLVKKYSVGQYLKRKKLLKYYGKPPNEQSYIHQSSDNVWRPWSKLDCLRTYYGFQLLFRRIAMRTWPNGCSCFGLVETIKQCSDMFGQEFAKGQECQGPDWIEIAKNIPDEIIDSTIEELKKRHEK